jgi:hypothetical protein
LGTLGSGLRGVPPAPPETVAFGRYLSRVPGDGAGRVRNADPLADPVARATTTTTKEVTAMTARAITPTGGPVAAAFTSGTPAGIGPR